MVLDVMSYVKDGGTPMNELMMDIQWDSVQCHLCGDDGRSEPIMLKGKELVDGQYGYSVHPVICRCGLVYLAPRWSKKDYDIFYKYYYDALYRLETKPDYGYDGVIKNMAVIWERIRRYLPGGVSEILDIGCGSGHGLKYLQEQNPGSTIYGIESSPQCIDILKNEVGGTLVTDDVESDWVSQYQGKFDLVIQRHVIEHILDPVESIKRIAGILKENGVMYIATPDMMRPRVQLRDYKKWWEYWFRAVHPYYYCTETLFTTLERAGLHPFVYGTENQEVWCLVKNTKDPESAVQYSMDNLYHRQKEVLDTYLP